MNVTKEVGNENFKGCWCENFLLSEMFMINNLYFSPALLLLLSHFICTFGVIFFIFILYNVLYTFVHKPH